MKRFFITLFSLLTFGFIFMNFTIQDKHILMAAKGNDFVIPADVQEILDNSCYGCHNADSKNEKGKKKLQFDKMDKLKTYKLVGKLADISDVVNEGDMPPEKVLKKYPEMKLSDEGKARLIDWATKAAEDLSSN